MRKSFLYYLAFAFSFTALFSLNTHTVISTLIPFGGQTLSVIPCTAALPNTLITVGQPKGGVFLDTAATFRYKHGAPAIRTGQWQLGMSGAPAPCVVFTTVCGLFGCWQVPIIAGFGNVKVFEGTSL